MWMGIDGGVVAWVSESKLENFSGDVLKAIAGVEPGMAYDGSVLTAGVESEKAWITEQMTVVKIAINYHQDGDPRATATEAAWRAYRCQLRDYVKAGVVVGDRPKMLV